MDEDAWQEYEDAYEEKDLYKNATCFEPQDLPDEVIRNAYLRTLPPLEVRTATYLSDDDNAV